MQYSVGKSGVSQQGNDQNASRWSTSLNAKPHFAVICDRALQVHFDVFALRVDSPQVHLCAPIILQQWSKQRLVTISQQEGRYDGDSFSVPLTLLAGKSGSLGRYLARCAPLDKKSDQDSPRLQCVRARQLFCTRLRLGCRPRIREDHAREEILHKSEFRVSDEVALHRVPKKRESIESYQVHIVHSGDRFQLLG